MSSHHMLQCLSKLMPCSIKEPGLYDYVIFNDDLEDAFAQLVLVAKRALSGKQGNGSQSITGPVTLVAEEEPSQASQPAASTAAPANATSAKVSKRQHCQSGTPEVCILTESSQAAVKYSHQAQCTQDQCFKSAFQTARHLCAGCWLSQEHHSGIHSWLAHGLIS